MKFTWDMKNITSIDSMVKYFMYELVSEKSEILQYAHIRCAYFRKKMSYKLL